MDQKTLLQLAKMHSTPLVVMDHKVLRENYTQFRKHLPRVQVYYAVKANSDPAIVQTFYDAGASFDVASMAEFLIVHEKIKHLPAQAAAGLHLGSHYLRQPDQGDRDAQAVGSIQAVGHLRQPRGGAQDRRLNGKIRRFCTAEDATDIFRGTPERVGDVHTIGQKATLISKIPIGVNCGNTELRCQRDDQLPMQRGEIVRHDNQPASRSLPSFDMVLSISAGLCT